MVSQTQTDISVWNLSYELNDLRFEYSATSFGNSKALEYQYFLEGNDNEWSAWSRNRKRTTRTFRKGVTLSVSKPEIQLDKWEKR